MKSPADAAGSMASVKSDRRPTTSSVKEIVPARKP
jgi:hypothetical protein